MMEKANKCLREELRAKSIPFWQVAQYVGVNETTIVRWFRVPLSSEQTERIYTALNRIDELRNGGAENADCSS